MINVAYDDQVFGFQRYGGVSRYFYELAKRVGSSHGFGAVIVAPLYVNRYLGGGGVKVAGLRIPRVPRTGQLVNAANHIMTSALLKVSRPDVLHETYYGRTSSAPKGCPIVTTVHDMIYEKFKKDFRPNDTISAKKFAAVERADRIICVSESTRSDLIEIFNPDPLKITTIHLGFAAYDAIQPTVLPSLPRPFLLYVGQRIGYKNFSRLLAAYASSSLLHNEFDLIAFGGDPFSRRETEAIRASGLNRDQCRHLFGDDSLLAYLYRKATALVYPSLYEGFGLPTLEAMSQRCPVVCSETSSIPEVVGDAGLYFDPNNSEAIRVAIESVCFSPTIRLDLIKRGTEQVKQFSFDRCAAQTMDVYRKAVLDGSTQ